MCSRGRGIFPSMGIRSISIWVSRVRLSGSDRSRHAKYRENVIYRCIRRFSGLEWRNPGAQYSLWSGMMSKSKGKFAAANEGTPVKPGAAKATSTAGVSQKRGAKPKILINASTKGFLLVDVCKGATKQQLIQAIDQALETSEIPYFTNNSQMASGQASLG